MSKKLIVIIILATVVLLALIGGGAYYLIKSKANSNPNSDSTSGENLTASAQPQKTDAEIKKEKEEQLTQLNKDYPDKVTGVITFADTAKAYKATVKADSGKEYLLSPAQPQSVLEALFGVKNGDKVEVQGKINNKGNLEWAIITPIE